MLIEQIHFPPSGPNWGKITVGAIVIFTLVAAVYISSRPKSASQFKPKSKKDNVA